MHYESYQDYLRHPVFKAIRSAVMAKAGHRCVHCGAPATEVHHKQYPTWGTFDVPENVEPICHACHCKIHERAA